MRKLFLFLLIVVAALLLGIVAFLICNSCGLCIGFYEFRFIDSISIIADVIIGGLLVVVLGIISSNESKLERKTAIAISILEKLYNVFDSVPNLTDGRNRNKFWAMALAAQSSIERDAKILLQNINDKKAREGIERLKEQSDMYFHFVQTELYENNKLTEELIGKERKQRDDVLNNILNCQMLIC